MRGVLLASTSIALVTYAQLAQKWGVVRLPLSGQWPLLLNQPLTYGLPLLMIVSGLVAYVVSMGCWLGALSHLPLNRAYPMLGLSYGLVYLGGIALPWYQGSFSWQGVTGVILIVAGVATVNLRRSPGIRED